MLDRTLEYIKSHQLLYPGEKVIVGLSGGADSVVLLYLLKKAGFECIAAHCNFHLRGAESDRDEKFVFQLTMEWNIPLQKADFETASIASDRGISVEMAARELRYAWFEELRKDLQAKAIAVAHHEDDNVETLLINLIRGTGIKGLTGMRPKNGSVIRPLLAFSRVEIMNFIAENRLDYITDSTNLEADFVRNRLRLQVLPQLQMINPAVKDSILQTMDNLNEAWNVYRDAIDKAKEEVFCRSRNSISIPRLISFASPEALLFEILKDYHFNPDVVRDIYRALTAQSGKEFFSSTHRLVKDRDALLLLPLTRPLEEEFWIYENDCLTHSPIEIKIIRKEKEPDFEIEKDRETACLDADLLEFPLKLRKWKEGDRFKPLGMNQFQKLSDFFNNQKFSKPQKEDTWLLTSGDEIIWIVGQRVDNRYKVTDRTRNLYVLKVF